MLKWYRCVESYFKKQFAFVYVTQGSKVDLTMLNNILTFTFR